MEGEGLRLHPPDHSNSAVPVFHRDFDYLDWIARLTSHIPEKGVQLVHYYGTYSNAHRRKALRRQAFTLPDPIALSTPPEQDPRWLKERRKSWARLIRLVYEADPLLCRCGERMRVVGFIRQAPVIRRILDHVGRRFDPLKLPGRAPPLFDDFAHDPFPDYGPQ